MALHGQMNHPIKLPGADPLTDEELRSITAPTTVIVAGRSAPFAPDIQAGRARLIPNVAVDVIPDAGHEVSWSHVEQCLAEMPVPGRGTS